MPTLFRPTVNYGHSHSRGRSSALPPEKTNAFCWALKTLSRSCSHSMILRGRFAVNLRKQRFDGKYLSDWLTVCRKDRLTTQQQLTVKQAERHTHCWVTQWINVAICVMFFNESVNEYVVNSKGNKQKKIRHWKGFFFMPNRKIHKNKLHCAFKCINRI